MSRYIDADTLKESINNCDICNICPDREVRCSYDCDFPDALTPKWETLIDAQPSIDIVRCKECKHCYVDGEQVKFNACELNHNKVQSDDWFCAAGEREGER